MCIFESKIFLSPLQIYFRIIPPQISVSLLSWPLENDLVESIQQIHTPQGHMKHFCGLGVLFRETAFSSSKKCYQNKGLIRARLLYRLLFIKRSSEKRIKEVGMNITRLEVTSMIQNHTTDLSGQLVWDLLRLWCTFHFSFSNTDTLLRGKRGCGD